MLVALTLRMVDVVVPALIPSSPTTLILMRRPLMLML
jgi:hypothetical protein